ncbi:hypothetical protein FZW96_20955 [Bacillus sp. BGMRC 2118]|nr:hypothetical protein FZW96_20955 [Bacillus sp. BGMRC 2118]
MYEFNYPSSYKKIREDDRFKDVAISVLDLYRESLNTDKPLSLPQSQFLLKFYKKEWGTKEDKFKERIYSLALLYEELIEGNPELIIPREQQMKFNNEVELLKKELTGLL